MSHQRTEIKAAIMGLLKGNTLAGDNVFINKLYPTDDSELPGLFIRAVSEQKEKITDTPKIHKRNFKLEIEVIVAEKRDVALELELDLVTAQIENLLEPDETLNGSCEDFEHESTEYNFSKDGSKSLGHCLLNCEALYTTEVAYPEITDEFSENETEWTVKGGDPVNDTNKVPVI